MEAPQKWRSLRQLIQELLTEAELRELFQDLRGRDLVAALPSSADVYHAAVDALERRGLIADELFVRLAEHAPGKLRRIGEVAEMWHVAPPLPGISNPRIHQVIAALAVVRNFLSRGRLASALTCVRVRQALLFPSSGDYRREGRTGTLIHMGADRHVLCIITAWDRETASSKRTVEYYALLGADIRIMDDKSNTLSTECRARLEQYVQAYPTATANLHLFVGTRAQLRDDMQLAAWEHIKTEYSSRRIFIRTTDGVIDAFGSRALGNGWARALPSDHEVLRPL